MYLLDQPLDRLERDRILRMLNGSICRICTSDDCEEIVRMLGLSMDYRSMLAYSRAKEVKAETHENV